MLDEEVLSRKLKILIVWLGAIENGEHSMSERGAATFIAVLEQCHDEALVLERRDEVSADQAASAEAMPRSLQVPGSVANVVILPVVQHLRAGRPLSDDETLSIFRQEFSNDIPV